MTPERRLLAAAALFGASGVGFGAFGAHGLAELVSAERLGTFETAVRYQLIHAVALLALAPANAGLRIAGALMAAGTVVFCGSLYLLVLLDAPWLGAVAPLGGALMILGWCVVAYRALRPRADGTSRPAA